MAAVTKKQRCGIVCPVCGGRSRVARTKRGENKQIRYRKCLNCGFAFSTVEMR